MDLIGITELLTKIGIHYPSFRKSIATKDGLISKAAAEEWHRVIGFLDLKDALSMFDTYLKLEEGNKFAPTISWFLQSKQKRPDFKVDLPRHELRVEYVEFAGKKICTGALIDEDGRPYAFASEPNELYHTDAVGRIINRKGEARNAKI